MPVRLLTLDLDNTLWETEPVIARAEQACYDWISTHCPQAAAFYSAAALHEYRLQIAACYPDLRFRLSQLRQEVLRRVFMQSGIDRDRSAALAVEAFQVFYRERSRVTFYAGAEEALRALAAAYPLMALTNGNADLELIGIRSYFQAHFSAEQVGAPKPDPALFQAALQQAGVTAADCIHMGDHPEQDIAAAAALGFRTLWINLSQAPWPAALPRPDAEVTHWAQVPQVIAALASH